MDRGDGRVYLRPLVVRFTDPAMADAHVDLLHRRGAVEETVRQVKARLRVLEPVFVSVTYGAGGSDRARTIGLVTRFKDELGIEAMAHLTCVGSSRARLREVLDTLAANGIENIMALRGDPPRGAKDFAAADDIRDQLARVGIVVEDTADGPRWSIDSTSGSAAADEEN